APSTYILAHRSETPQSRTPPLLPIHLPKSSPPLLLPSTSHRADVLEVILLPRKRLCIALGPRYKDEMLVGMLGAPTTDEIELGRRMTDFVTTVRQDTGEIYWRMDDAQDDRLMETEARLSCQAWVQSMEVIQPVLRGTNSGKDTANIAGIIAETAGTR
nr:hypothetical protein [Tanacetum cinerariifolium]